MGEPSPAMAACRLMICTVSKVPTISSRTSLLNQHFVSFTANVIRRGSGQRIAALRTKGLVNLTSAVLPERLAQFGFQHFPDTGQRQRVPELDTTRNLVTGDTFAAVGDNLLLGDACSRVANDHCVNRLARDQMNRRLVSQLKVSTLLRCSLAVNANGLWGVF